MLVMENSNLATTHTGGGTQQQTQPVGSSSALLDEAPTHDGVEEGGEKRPEREGEGRVMLFTINICYEVERYL